MQPLVTSLLSQLRWEKSPRDEEQEEEKKEEGERRKERRVEGRESCVPLGCGLTQLWVEGAGQLLSSLSLFFRKHSHRSHCIARCGAASHLRALQESGLREGE